MNCILLVNFEIHSFYRQNIRPIRFVPSINKHPTRTRTPAKWNENLVLFFMRKDAICKNVAQTSWSIKINFNFGCIMNGFSTGEEDSRGPTDQICCLIDKGDRCTKAAGNASYSKRIQKTVTQRRLNLILDNSVSNREKRVYYSFNMCLFSIVG